MATCKEEITISHAIPDSKFCLPCQRDRKRLTAAGYCETCNAFLCKRCFDCHTVPVPMRNHRLLKSKQNVMEHQVNNDIGQCPEHEGELVLYHCPNHSFLGCHTCFFQHQKACREVRYIPDISETFNSLDEFKKFMTTLKHATKISKDLVEECKRNITLVEKCHTDAVAAIKAFKSELLEAIDQFEKDLYEKANDFKQKETTRLSLVADKYLQDQTKIQDIATELSSLLKKKRQNDLYITMVKSKTTLLSLEAEFDAAKVTNMLKLIKFEGNVKFREVFKSQLGLGKLRITPDVLNSRCFNPDLKVKLKQGDNQTCSISGCVVISKRNLVIADSGNRKVKVIDTYSGESVILSQ